MTDKERVVKLLATIREFQAREQAFRVLLSRCRFEGSAIPWKQAIEEDVKEDLAPSSLFGQNVAQFQQTIASVEDGLILQFLYKEITEPRLHMWDDWPEEKSK